MQTLRLTLSMIQIAEYISYAKRKGKEKEKRYLLFHRCAYFKIIVVHARLNAPRESLGSMCLRRDMSLYI